MKGSCRLEDGCFILLLKGMTSTQVCKPVNPLALWEGCAAWSGGVLVSALYSSTRTRNSVQVPCSAGQKLECAPLYIIDGMCFNLKTVSGNWSFKVSKTQPPKQPHSSQTLIHELDSPKPRVRRDFIRPGRPLIIEGLGPHLVSLDCGAGRVEAHGEMLRVAE